MKYLITIILLIIFTTGCSKVQNVSYTSTETKNYKKQIQVNKKLDSVVEQQSIIEQITNDSSVFVKNNSLVLVFPSHEIGKYAIEASNTINAFLLWQGKETQLSTYDIKYQDRDNIIGIFEKIKSNNISKVILMITSEHVESLENIKLDKKMTVYLPLVNKNDIKDISLDPKMDIIYAAIDYDSQINQLVSYIPNKQIVHFYDNNKLGHYLRMKMRKIDTVYDKKVDNNNGDYDRFLKKNNMMYGSSVFLNTAIIKSSILLSQFRAFELEVSNVLSTQLNYNRSILSLTQKKDRQNMIVASSIGYIPEEILQYSQLAGNDLEFNWVNYSILIGTYYLTNKNIDIFTDVKLEKNSIVYPVYLYKVGDSSFKRIKSQNF